MRAPKWWTDRQESRRALERQLLEAERRAEDADTRAVNAVRTAESLREQVAICRQRCDDLGARATVAQQAATEHARTLSQVRQLVAKLGAYTFGQDRLVATSVAMEFVSDLRAVLNGDRPVPTGSGGGPDAD